MKNRIRPLAAPLMALAAITVLAAPLGASPQEAKDPAPQTVTLRPHFTEQSKRIVVPQGRHLAHVQPEIREGMIAIDTSSGFLMYVNADSGEYAWGMDSDLWAQSAEYGYRPQYFSGGAAMVWKGPRDEEAPEWSDAPSPVIVYPNGTYREPLDPDKVNGFVGFNEGYALVAWGSNKNNAVSFIDKDGRSVFPQLTVKADTVWGLSSPDLRVYPLVENRRVYHNAGLEKYGYIDAKWAMAIKPQFDRAKDFSEGMAAVMNKDENGRERWGFIDATGKMVIPATYKLEPGRFSEGLAAVKIGDESSYEMAYIDKTGKRVMESKPWELGEFHGGFAWVGKRSGYSDRSVINDKFEEVRVVSTGQHVSPTKLTFRNGSQAIGGRIFAPDGTVLFDCVDTKGQNVDLHDMTDGDLMLCSPNFYDEPRLKEKIAYSLQCFINKQGEIVYYFEEGVEGFEGKAPVQVKNAPAAKAAPAQQAKPAQGKPAQSKPKAR